MQPLTFENGKVISSHTLLDVQLLIYAAIQVKPCYWRESQVFHTHHMSHHCTDVITSVMSSQITILTIVYTTVYSGADKRKHQSFASLAFVRGNPRWPVNSPHKGPVTREMFPFDDVIMHIPVILIMEIDLTTQYSYDRMLKAQRSARRRMLMTYQLLAYLSYLNVSMYLDMPSPCILHSRDLLFNDEFWSIVKGTFRFNLP